jgi:23S rRNA (guanosine2251-2'-O)-methyltransferase
MREWLTGRNPVYEALVAKRRNARRVHVAEGVKEKGRITEILKLCDERRILVERVARSRLDSLGAGHQGVALEVSGYLYSDLIAILELAALRAEPPLILLLDSLNDPHNLGSLIRTAEVVGAHGVVLPLRHTAAVTPAVVSVSSGACEHMLVARANLVQAIETFKSEDIWVFGLDVSAEAKLPNQVNLSGPLALVVGSEGRGMRALVRSSCDVLLRLPMRGRIDSLNAAIAGSVALYLVWQTRQFTGARESTIDDTSEA